MFTTTTSGATFSQNRFNYTTAPEQQSFNFAFSTSGGTTTVCATPQPKDTALFLSDDVLQSCKCDYCSCYVSVGPVRMIDNKVACGRCKTDTEGVRLLMVEALAKQFKFPCRYKNSGCTAVLKWISVDSHEKICDFKEIQCTIMDCGWVGAKSTLRIHFEQKHPDEIIKSQKGIQMSIQEKKTSNFLYLSRNKTFLVLLLNDGEYLYHQIKFFCAGLEASMYLYDICINETDKKLTYLNQKIQCFDDDTGVANAGLSITLLQSVFPDSHSVKISLQIKFATETIANITVKDVECPVCFEPMIKNIIVGTCGHSVCEQCKKSLSNCPSCRKSFAVTLSGTTTPGIRNYNLEEVVRKLNIYL